MSFPLAQKVLIRGSAAHIKAGLGAGVDYRTVFDDSPIPLDLLMPFNGVIDRVYSGTQGGKWLDIVDPDGIRLQFAHLDRYFVKAGQSVRQGQTIAITGNTGQITTGPHLHIQGIKNSKRVRLDNYNWDKFNTPGGSMSPGDDLAKWIIERGKKQAYKVPGQPELYLTFHVRDPGMAAYLGLRDEDNKLVEAALPSELQAILEETRRQRDQAATAQYEPINEVVYRKKN